MLNKISDHRTLASSPKKMGTSIRERDDSSYPSACIWEPDIKRKVKPIIVSIVRRGCWKAVSHKSKNGYGRTVIYRNGKTLQLHRYLHELLNGPIDKENLLIQSCSTDGCCNPEHYESKARWEIATEEFMYRNNPQGYYNMLFVNKTRKIRTSIKQEESQHREIPDWLVAMVEKRVGRAHLEALGETRSFYGRNTDIPFIKPDWAIMKPKDESEDKQLTN